jgi:hypothetical protein
MELDEIGIDDVDYPVDQGVIRIDQHGHRGDTAPRRCGKALSLLDRHVARAARKHDQAGIVRPGRHGGIENGGRAHAANFDLNRHSLARG